mmetsp:Transcript_21066/g.44233  ORF Transcript_21066/g.44233 Transcript_21066/m.44233 type:complete len:303 (-) Transcript_21066:76-984(-)
MTSGSESSISAQVICRDRPSESGAIASSVPIKRAMSGIQCPPQKGGSIHSITSIRFVVERPVRFSRTSDSSRRSRDRSSPHFSLPLSDTPAASATSCRFPTTSRRFIGVSRTILASSIPASSSAIDTVLDDGAQTWHRSCVTMRFGDAFFSRSLSIGYRVGISPVVVGEPLVSSSSSPIASSAFFPFSTTFVWMSPWVVVGARIWSSVTTTTEEGRSSVSQQWVTPTTESPRPRWTHMSVADGIRLRMRSGCCDECCCCCCCCTESPESTVISTMTDNHNGLARTNNKTTKERSRNDDIFNP